MTKTNSSFQFIKKTLAILFLTFICIYFALVLMGKGFGKKNNPSLLISDKNCLFFAHRGIINSAPENSFKAIKLAKEKGFSAIEIDIMESSDEELILFHDLTGNRLLNNPLIIKNTPFEIIKNLPLYHNEKPTNQYVISLQTVFKNFGSDFIYYLDLKCEDTIHFRRLIQKLNRLLQKYNLYENVIIASSNLFFLGYIEYNYPKINTVLEGFNAGKEWIYSITPKLFRPDFLASFYYKINKEHINWLYQKGLLNKKIVYGVTKENYEKLICSFGIKKMIIDYDYSFEKMNELKVKCPN